MADVKEDIRWMRLALELAARGLGAVEPNPMVGCVLVRDGQQIGQGWHKKFGDLHAEASALKVCKNPKGATAYVTLEPCSHTGKTPPCADALIKAGIERVVVGSRDPNPQVAGSGIGRLEAAGIKVDTGVCGAQADAIIAPFAKWITTKLPWVIAKWAMSKNGKISTPPGASPWISNEQSRAVVHDIRRRVDAILVGIGTVLTDDPLLTARPAGSRKLTRVVLDSDARTPLDSKLVESLKEVKELSPVLICVGAAAESSSVENLRESGCEVLVLDSHDRYEQLVQVMNTLGSRSVTNLLVEGGSKILATFLEQLWVDEVHCFISPNEIDDNTDCLVSAPFTASNPTKLAAKIGLGDYEIKDLSGDTYLYGRTSALRRF